MIRVCKNSHVTGRKKCPLCEGDAYPTRVRVVEPEPEPARPAARVSAIVRLRSFVFRDWRKAHREKVELRRAAKAA